MHAFDGQTDGRTDGQTDGRTEFSSQDRVCILCSAVKISDRLQITSYMASVSLIVYMFYSHVNTTLAAEFDNALVLVMHLFPGKKWGTPPHRPHSTTPPQGHYSVNGLLRFRKIQQRSNKPDLKQISFNDQPELYVDDA